MAHVAPQKLENVKNLVRTFEQSLVIGIVNIRGIPAPQIQAMRKKLVGRAKLVVSKNNLLRIALKEAAAKKKGLDGLAEVIQDQTAVVTAEINPFRLFKEMEATKTKAPPAAESGLPTTSGSLRGTRRSSRGRSSGTSRRRACPRRSSGGRS